MSTSLRFFASAPRGIEALLVGELAGLGASDVAPGSGGVAFGGDLAVGYRACLWSRLASRVLLELGRFAAADADALYAGVQAIDWPAQFAVDRSFAVGFTTRSRAFPHSHYAALKAKDAVADRFRAALGQRPNVNAERPDLRLHLHAENGQVSVYLDLAGEALHRRAWRIHDVAAPLKENLAAAILLRGGWPAVAAGGGALVDPLCGSGTFLIEAALLAADIAPGLLRRRWGFEAWSGHDAALWADLRAEATRRREAGLTRLPPITGYDRDPRAVRAALDNLRQAGLEGRVHVERRAVSEAEPRGAAGLVVANPPYGERLGDTGEALQAFAELGSTLRERFCGWKAVVLAGNEELGFRLGIRARRTWALYNGPIACSLLLLEVEPERFFTPHTASDLQLSPEMRQAQSLLRRARRLADPATAGGDMLANRLHKNLRSLRRWTQREGIACYRVYDADLPEFALAIDLYRGDALWAHVQEYAPPRSIDPERAEARLLAALAVIPAAVGVAPERMVLKVRRRQQGQDQYQKQAQVGQWLEVGEGGLRFLVNLHDYLDTGLFLDHRITRGLLRQWAEGGRFLNLFAYTGSATVYAAAGGATETTSVDLSHTYLDWAARNLALNGFAGPRHRLVPADCLEWLEAASRRGGPRFELVFLDPPTFSNSKRMAGTLDVQRDQTRLILAAARLLASGGRLVFSTNQRRFKLDEAPLRAAGLTVLDLGARTLPRDFERNPHIHRCWLFEREGLNHAG